MSLSWAIVVAVLTLLGGIVIGHLLTYSNHVPGPVSPTYKQKQMEKARKERKP